MDGKILVQLLVDMIRYDTGTYQARAKKEVSELLIGKRAVNVRRDSLQRVRDESVPMGEAEGWSKVECRFIEHVHALVALSTCLLAHNESLHP